MKIEGKTASSVDTERKTKAATVIEMLQQERGADIAEIGEVTGWQKHTVRAALTGLKKKGHVIERTKVDGVSRYTIAKASSK